jgi:hypothetical protein
LQGDITISKQHNQLKGGVIEALQCMKCLLCHNLLFHEAGPSSLTEVEADDSENNAEPGEVGDDDKEGWDALILDDKDDESMDET